MSEPTVDTPSTGTPDAIPHVASETDVTSEADRPVKAKIGWLLPALSLLWLAGKLWASHEQIQDAGGGTVAVATAAAALPGVFQAALVGAAGAGLITTAWTLRPLARWLAAIAAGVIVCGATAALIAASYSHMPSIGTIAISLVICGGVAGAVVAIRRAALPIAGGIAGTLAVLVGMTVLNSNAILSRMLRWYGGDTSAASYVHASKLVQYTDFALVGILAGIVAFLYLRRRSVTGFPPYLLAGATAGVVLLIAYAMTNLGGSDLLDAAKSISDADRLINEWESSESVPNAMIVLFVGAFTALIAFGRTLKPASRPKSITATTDQPQ